MMAKQAKEIQNYFTGQCIARHGIHFLHGMFYERIQNGSYKFILVTVPRQSTSTNTVHARPGSIIFND